MNCCSVNAPRGLSEVSRYATVDHDSIAHINYFGKGAYATNCMAYSIEGNYPYDNNISMKFHNSGTVRIRIPEWSVDTCLILNGEALDVVAGTYYETRVREGDSVMIRFDFSIRTLNGENVYSGKKCFYRGPILLGLDQGENPEIDFDNLPSITAEDISEAVCETFERGRLSLRLNNGMILEDFSSLGRNGNPYRSWLN